MLLVSEDADVGPILDQVLVSVMPDDTPLTLSDRARVAENPLYPAILTKACRDRRVISS